MKPALTKRFLNGDCWRRAEGTFNVSCTLCCAFFCLFKMTFWGGSFSSDQLKLCFAKSESHTVAAIRFEGSSSVFSDKSAYLSDSFGLHFLHVHSSRPHDCCKAAHTDFSRCTHSHTRAPFLSCLSEKATLCHAGFQEKNNVS